MVSSKSLLKDQVLPSTQQDLEEDKHGENHLEGKGSYLKTAVFGGLDGVLTMFAVVSGAVGAAVTPQKILSLSLGSLLASAFSMAYGEYISTKAELDFVNSEKAREEFEILNCPEVEQKEMFDIYTKRYNFSKSEANTLVEVSFKKKDFFLKHMMVEELGIMLESTESTPLKKSLMMALSFIVMGLFPLVGYLFLVLFGKEETDGEFFTFLFTVIFSVLGSALLGYFKGKILETERVPLSVLHDAQRVRSRANFISDWVVNISYVKLRVSRSWIRTEEML
ncbi:uncharacterized protein TA07935 [Theileria annulata]|uniref:Integral membrane protein n=1 Tax=Theileria annulata TaxID=5874 RepID=Q4U9W9_THEAN|nr:uncharacterized protein TA07935 [Theileria annulata]CAI76384.1 hypothetical protein, conserved [Theileria annulata]|eukprot:XP_953009.1 hypothetical protein, conserved [Theileria annulata]